MKKTGKNGNSLEKRLALLRTTVKELAAADLGKVAGGCYCYSAGVTHQFNGN